MHNLGARTCAVQAFSGCVLAALSAGVFAANPRPAAAPRAFFTDQPKGLGENVLAWKLNYVGEVFGNLSGGVKQGTVYEGYFKLGLGVNLEKLAGWKDTVFYANILYPHGKSLTQNYVGDLNVVSNIDSYDSVRLFKCWVQKNFAENRFSLRAGIMAVDKEFFVSEDAALFINSGFGAFPVISQGIIAPVYPVSAPGIRIHWKPTEALSVLAAVFSGDVGTASLNQHNSRLDFRGSDGVSVFAEAAYKLNASGGGRRGTYKIGGFYSSKAFEDLAGSPQHDGNYGVYAIADQLIFREGGGEDGTQQGLAVFARFAVAPEDRNFVPFDTEVGATYTGLLPRRDGDLVGVGLIYSKISDQGRDEVGEPFREHHEAVLEVSYQAAVNDWLTVQPDFQYIFNPGAARHTRDAIVAGLRISLNF
jgi:porin